MNFLGDENGCMQPGTNAPMKRRTFVELSMGAVVSSLIRPGTVEAASDARRIEAVAFDAFPIFDPRPVFAWAGKLFPGEGAELSQIWRARQFEYTWLRTVAGYYTDFWRITEDALTFAAGSLKLDLNPSAREQLMNAYLTLKPWPDVVQALETLKSAGIRLALLSNFSRRMLDAAVSSSNLHGAFDHILSTDKVRQFKPAPKAYQMAVDAFGVSKESIIFAAFAGWDAAGAKWFGFPTVWVNRLNSPREELSAAPELICQDLSGLTAFATAQRSP